MHAHTQRRMDELEALEAAAAAAAEGEQRASPPWRRSRSARAALPPGARMGGWGGAMAALLPGWPDPFAGVFGGPPPWLGGAAAGGPGVDREAGGPPGHPAAFGMGGRLMGRSGMREMREMMAAARNAGLPPHVLFSDRDFTPEDYEALCRLDDTVENRKGATQQEIEALPVMVGLCSSCAACCYVMSQAPVKALWTVCCSLCLHACLCCLHGMIYGWQHGMRAFISRLGMQAEVPWLRASLSLSFCDQELQLPYVSLLLAAASVLVVAAHVACW